MIRKTTTLDELLRALNAAAEPAYKADMNHFGSRPAHALGVRIPAIRALAKGLRDHDLAAELWATGIHEARILACFVDDPKKITREQMDAWAAAFDSWDVCDQACGSLFVFSPHALDCIHSWCANEREYVRRAGFALIASGAWKWKDAPDEVFRPFLALTRKYARDDRNFVKKAVNWALRQIGKRNPSLREEAIQTAKVILMDGTRAGKWVAQDALRELQHTER